MIDQGIGYYAIITLIAFSFMAVTIIIPIYGYFHKRWKGLARGCIIQPIVCALIVLLTVLGVYFYQKHDFKKHREAAMVTVKKKVDSEGMAQIWHLKPNEECFFERRNINRKSEFLFVNRIKLYDVVPLDSSTLCVDDKIFVKFDLKKHKVTASEFDEPLDVVSVNWDKVSSFFSGR